MADLTYQRPGDLLPQATVVHSMEHTTTRPFPQAVVYPDTRLLTKHSVFPTANAKQGMAKVEVTDPAPANPPQKPAAGGEPPAKPPKMSAGIKILIGVGIVVGVILLIEFNR